jgi:plastocyanin
MICLAGQAYAAEAIVTQSHTTFDNDEITVNAGDTVVFKNKDDVTHNIQITDSSGTNEDKGLQKPGEDIRETLAKPGEYIIHCAIHPKMKMKITVQ